MQRWKSRMRFWLAIASFCTVSQVSALTIYTEDWPPITFLNKGVADGMAVELVREMQSRLQDNTAIEVVPWARGYKELLSRPGVMLFTIGRSEAREKQMILLGPIGIAQTLLLARKGEAAKMRALGSEIYHRPLGAYRGSIFVDAAFAAGFVEVDLAPTPQIVAQKLFSKRYDLWVEGSFAVPSLLKDIQQPRDSVEVVRVLESLELYLAFSRGTANSEVKRWQSALESIKKDGTFKRTYAKWLPTEQAPEGVRLLGIPGD